MRIIAGAWRGRAIQAPAGTVTRPTSDRAREALFSMLVSRLGTFEGLRAADLFAGSGALGLEALSRGAAYCTFVENDRQAIETLRRNLARLGAGDRADVRAQSVAHAPPPIPPCDILFMDPPYGSGLAEIALDRAAAWLAPRGWASIETDGAPLPIPAPFETMAERRFGKAMIVLLRKQ